MKRLAEVTGLPLAWKQPSTWREACELADGRRYLASTNTWQTRYEITDEAGESLLLFAIGGVFRQSAGVIVEPAAVRLAELPLLITLGWYLAVMMHQDSSAAAVVVAA